jgi:hypothetical protein
MNRSWLYYISPCALAAVLCVIGIIQGFAGMQGSDGWSFLAVIMGVPALFILLLVDIVVKMITKGKVLYIWIFEIIAIVILVIWFNFYYS